MHTPGATGARPARFLAPLLTATVPALALAALVVFGLLRAPAVVAGSAATVPDPGPANSAALDTAATTELLGSVEQAVETVFSFDPADARAQADAAARFLTGEAVAEVATLTDPAKFLASRTRVRTTVKDAAAESLSATRARALVFVSQEARTEATGQTSTAGAQFAVDTQREGGGWRIAKVTFEPATEPPVPASEPGGPTQRRAAERDSAVAAAQRVGTALVAADHVDPEGALTRMEGVTTGELLRRLRADHARLAVQMREGGATATAYPNPAAAATRVDGTAGKVTVLLALRVSVRGAAGEWQRPYPVRLVMTRTGQDWKAESIESIPL